MDASGVNETLNRGGLQKVISLGKRATNLQYEEALQAARETMLALREKNVGFKEENEQLRDLLKNKEEYILDKGVYWQKNDKEQNQPFCPVCYSKGKITPLQKHREGKDKKQSPWSCPAKDCSKGLYNPWDYKEPDPPSPQWQDFGFGY